MTSLSAARLRYVDDSLSTASGPRIVVMVFGRIDRDLAVAIEAIQARDVERAHDAMCHAQALVQQLHDMLDLDAWEHARALASVYDFAIERLTLANVAKRVADVETVRSLLGELGQAFAAAASKVTDLGMAGPATADSATVDPATGDPATVDPATVGRAAPEGGGALVSLLA